MNLRESITDIYDARGELTPAILVEEATPKSHPLHHRFEWDNRLAGPKYREVQARELIRFVKVVKPIEGSETHETLSVRAFVSIDRGDGSRSYKPTEVVISNELEYTALLRDMKRRWTDLKATYGHLVEFKEMITGGEEAA